MKHSILRTTGLALVLANGAQLCSAQQIGTGQPNNVNGIQVYLMGVFENQSSACVGNRAYQVAAPGTSWNQNYGGPETYFTLPAGNGDQSCELYLLFNRNAGGMYNAPLVQVFVDGELCSSCSASVLTFNSSGGGSSAECNLLLTHQAGYSHATHGVHEFGLRFTFPPAAGPWLDIRFKAMMVGTSYSQMMGTYLTPALPLFILRDPPGDASYSTLAVGGGTCYGNSQSVTSDNTQEGYFKARLGVAGSYGMGVTMDYEIYGEVGVNVTGSQTQTELNEYQTCLEATSTFTTPQTGVPDDMFIGSAVRYAYGFAMITERPSCDSLSIRYEFASNPISDSLNYHYTESHIRNTIIPDLVNGIADMSPDDGDYFKSVQQLSVWNQLLAMNDSIKEIAAYDDTKLFSGAGGAEDHTVTTTTDRILSIEYATSLGGGFNLEFGANLGGSGVTVGGIFNFRNEYGNAANASNSTTKTMTYYLEDSSVGDDFGVIVKKDPVFGTFVFTLDSAGSSTSCPYEGGYQRDQPQLWVGSMSSSSAMLNEVPIGGNAIFPIYACNNSDEERDYVLSLFAQSNPLGAIISGYNGITSGSSVTLTIPANTCLPVGNIYLAQPDNSVVDFDGIELYLSSACGDGILSTVSIGAHFGEGNFGTYCIPSSEVGPAEGDWVDGVQIGAINNTATGGFAAGAYTDYSAQLSTALPRGSQQLITLTAGPYSGDIYAAWIDYDRSGTFEPVEKLGELAITSAFGSENVSFTVPNTAALGSTILRVRCAWNVANMDACASYAYGETEDYAVVINNNTPQDCMGMNNGPALPGTSCNDANADTGNDTWNANCSCLGQLLDCAGTPGGTAVAGTPCDDGNANTAGDAYDNSCACVGVAYDCQGLPGGNAQPGTACDDGNAATGDDTWSANCICDGLLIDCMGNVGGSTLPGTACDDGNPLSGGDAYDANCQCIGSFPVDCAGVPNGPAQPGNPCDDGDSSTGNDAYSSNCLCVGEAYDCAGNPGGDQLPGTTCDDGNPESINDVFTANCACLGELSSDCAGVPGGSAQPGTACDDGDTFTGNDMYNAFCECIGELIDCEGVAGGFELPGAPCNDGEPDTGNDLYTLGCTCEGQPYDCEGTPGGTSIIGSTCNDGSVETSNDVYTANCVCAGTLPSDCEGVVGGPAQPGTSCDDGDENTGNDVFSANCACAGELIDCEGTIGGAALPGSACDDGDDCTVSDVFDGSCTCAGTILQISMIAGDALVYTGTTNTYSINPVPGATGYSWTLPNGWSSNSTTDFVLIAQAGTSVGAVSLCVDVQVGNCVLNTCLLVNVELSTGMNAGANTSERWFTVQPNPSNGIFQFIPAGDQGAMNVTVYDATGRTVKAAFPVADKRTVTIDLNNVDAGTYYLMATRDDQQRIVPLVVVR